MDEEEYITLKQAARLGGYRNPDMLYRAVRTGRLKAIRPAGGVLLTTRAWLAEYQAELYQRTAAESGETGE